MTWTVLPGWTFLQSICDGDEPVGGGAIEEILRAQLAALEAAGGDAQAQARTVRAIINRMAPGARVPRRERVRVAYAAVGEVMREDPLRMVELLVYRFVDPGQQSFCHAHLRDSPGAAIAHVGLWRP